MISRERRKELIDNKSMELCKQIQYCQRYKQNYFDFKSGEMVLDVETADNLFFMLKNDKDFSDCLKIIHSDSSRYNRLYKRIMKYFEIGDCLFLTLTFRDDVLESTDKKTRRVYVRRFLKEFSNAFLANIDYGAKTGREHYHALIVYPDPSMLAAWSYGFSNAKRCIYDAESGVRLANYILKIANHFVKDSVGSDRLIYSVYRGKWVYKDPPPEFIYLEDEQLTFWDGMPGNYNKFDRGDYLE